MQKEKKPDGEEDSLSKNDTAIIEEESRKKRKKKSERIRNIFFSRIKIRSTYDIIDIKGLIIIHMKQLFL